MIMKESCLASRHRKFHLQYIYDTCPFRCIAWTWLLKLLNMRPYHEYGLQVSFYQVVYLANSGKLLPLDWLPPCLQECARHWHQIILYSGLVPGCPVNCPYVRITAVRTCLRTYSWYCTFDPSQLYPHRQKAKFTSFPTGNLLSLTLG